MHDLRTRCHNLHLAHRPCPAALATIFDRWLSESWMSRRCFAACRARASGHGSLALYFGRGMMVVCQASRPRLASHAVRHSILYRVTSCVSWFIRSTAACVHAPCINTHVTFFLPPKTSRTVHAMVSHVIPSEDELMLLNRSACCWLKLMLALPP